MSQIKFNFRRIHSTAGKNGAFTTVRLYLKKTFELAVWQTVCADYACTAMKKAPCGEVSARGKACACGRIVVRQRPLTLRSKVVTTEMQLDINVERLLLNRGRLTAHQPQL